MTFYKRYNPERIQYLGGVLDKFIGREEDLNAEMRNKYNADLNGVAVNAVAQPKKHHQQQHHHHQEPPRHHHHQETPQAYTQPEAGCAV